MKEIKLEKCIQELNKQSKYRDQTIITEYIKTLEPFMNLIEEKSEDSEEIIKKISKIMSYQNNKTNDLIIKYGEKGNNFYIILKGVIGILVPKNNEYYMDEEDFIMHLLKLRRYNENELINQCLRQNALIFSLPTENLDELLYDFKKKKIKKGFFTKKKKVINKIKEVYNYINSEQYINDKKNIKNITPENYISLIEVDENIKKNTEKLHYLNQLNIEFDTKDEDKKLTKIPNYEMISILSEGDTFGEFALENINKKRKAAIIALSDCDFAVINKMEYNELIKDSVNKSKNKFFNLIYKYKIFDSITYGTFDRKYYNHFKYLKMKKNEILFNEGNVCDEVYFIVNGEYELYVDKNIQEVNEIILQLKDIVTNLKKIIIHETMNIINKNIKNKDKSYIKLKKNMDLFFNKFENEINLEELSYIIKNRDIIAKKKYFGRNYEKIISEKNRIKLGIYKSRQIIGLTDIINRFIENNKSFFTCKCFSFSGELYHIKYSNFLLIYENEDNVKLHTCELLFQNIYYIIGRLISHKKYIYEKAVKKENDFINLMFLENNNQNINNNVDNNKINKNSINIMSNKIKISPLNIDINKIHNNNFRIKSDDLNSFSNEKNYSDINLKVDDLQFKKNVNLNILSYINIWRINNNNVYYNSLSENKNTDNKIENYNNIINNNSTSNNNISNIESYIFSKNNNKNINSTSYKNKKKNIKFNSKNLLSQNTSEKKSKYDKFCKKYDEKIKFPFLIINDKEVKINEVIKNNKSNSNKNYKNILKSIDSKNKKLIDLINSKELKNITIYDDHNYSIEMRQKYKNLFRKKDFFLSRNNNILKIKNLTYNNKRLIKNYSDKNKLNSINNNNDNKTKTILIYNLSDMTEKSKQMKIKINELIQCKNFQNYDKNKLNANDSKPKNNFNNSPHSLTYRNTNYNNLYNFKNISNLPLKNSFLKKNLSDTFY